jgi:hypothetical protein
MAVHAASTFVQPFISQEALLVIVIKSAVKIWGGLGSLRNWRWLISLAPFF